MDTNHDEKIDFHEFVKGVARIALERDKQLYQQPGQTVGIEVRVLLTFLTCYTLYSYLQRFCIHFVLCCTVCCLQATPIYDEEEEEEMEEIPPDLKDLPPSEQQLAIKMRALLMMSLVCVCVGHFFFFFFFSNLHPFYYCVVLLLCYAICISTLLTR